MWIDFHSHILPGVDDGAVNVETSLKILRMLRDQGVERVALTPHFYAHRHSVECFLKKRTAAFERLLEAMGDESFPELLLGAEVAFEYDLEKVDGLKALCLENTPFLMMELPTQGYSPWILDKAISICYANESLPVIAHLDRYIGIYSDDQLETIAKDPDSILQLNVSSLLHWNKRKKCLSWVNGEKPIVFGSDSHDAVIRAPQFDRAIKLLQKKIDQQDLQKILSQAKSISEGEIPAYLGKTM